MPGYDKERLIGRGMYGTVWLVKSRLSRHSYVLKEIDFNSATELERQQALNEALILSKCQNVHVIRYKDALLDPQQRTLSIIMEYAEGGDLNSAIKGQNGVLFPEQQVLSWFIQLCKALEYIHSQNILHRDLKTQNIFLTRTKVIKIGDFGVARVLRRKNELASTSIGTPYYVSPEICLNKPYNFKSDIWALGCVLFEMAALNYAFAAVDYGHLMSLILSGKRGDLPIGTSDAIRELVHDLLKCNPAERPSAEDILAYHSLQPYLVQYMTNQNSLGSFVPLLATHQEVDRRMSGNVFKQINNTKRTDAILIPNPRTSGRRDAFRLPNQPGSSKRRDAVSSLPNQPGPSKQRTDAQKKENAEKGNKIQARQASKGILRVIPRACSTSKYANSPIHQKKYFPSTHDSSPGFDFPLPDSIKPSSLLASSDKVFELPQLAECKITKSENGSISDIDYGYQSQSIYSGESDGFRSCETASQSKQHFENMAVSTRNLEQQSLPGSESPTHCQHAQCHECMLNLLWENRIRLTENSSVNTDEHTKLKNKLLLVFEPNIFKKVYQSLINDWEKENITKSSFLCIANSLSFDQVQSLPLMMQLIQLDLLTKSR